MKKLIRVTTVAGSLKILLKGQLNFMSSHFEVVGVASPDAFLEDVRVDEGIRVVPITMTRTISPIKDLKSFLDLRSLFSSEKPLIVHTHTPKAGIAGMLAAKIVGVKIRMHTVAGLPLMEAKGIKRLLLNFIEKLTYYCATHVYPNSQGLYDFILANKLCPEKKLKVLANGSSNGIDVNHFDISQITENQQQELRSSLNIQTGDYVFIFVGRLVKDKGINELISAFQKLAEKNTSIKLILVGSYEAELDPLKPETIVAIKENMKIISVGFQKDVRPYFAISDALVFPSYREGFPNVVLQAGAMGLPAIVSDINGCNEIIQNGINGTIVPVKNEVVLQGAMEKYSQKRATAPNNAICRKVIVDSYQREIVWQALLAEYKLKIASVS